MLVMLRPSTLSDGRRRMLAKSVAPRKRRRKEAAKKELAEEKARLRKLKIEDVQEKLRKIKQAAGLRGKDLQEEDWARFLDDSWDDARWEEEMQKRFGEAYYGDEDIENEEEHTEAQAARKKRKIKKPKWDDDIDIGDIVPDFDGDEETGIYLVRRRRKSHQRSILRNQTARQSPKRRPKIYKERTTKDKKIARKERKIDRAIG